MQQVGVIVLSRLMASQHGPIVTAEHGLFNRISPMALMCTASTTRLFATTRVCPPIGNTQRQTDTDRQRTLCQGLRQNSPHLAMLAVPAMRHKRKMPDSKQIIQCVQRKTAALRLVPAIAIVDYYIGIYTGI